MDNSTAIVQAISEIMTSVYLTATTILATTTTTIATQKPCTTYTVPECDPLMIEEIPGLIIGGVSTNILRCVGSRYFNVYGTILAFIVGIPGSVLTIIIIARMRPINSSSVWLLAMSSIDLFSLSMRAVINILHTNHIAPWYDPSCRFFYITGCTCEYSVYFFLVGLTMERFIAVWFPLRMNTWCSKRRAAILIAVILIALVSFNLYIVETMRVNGEGNCVMRQKYIPIWQYIYQNYVENTFFILLPVFMVIVLNILIFVRLRTARRFQKKTTDQQVHEKDKQQARINRMLMAASIWFIVCVWIEIVLRYAAATVFAFKKRTPLLDRARVIVLNTSAVMRTYNHAANFVLYVIAARKFRSEVVRLITCNTYVSFGKRATTVSKSGVTDTKITSDGSSASG